MADGRWQVAGGTKQLGGMWQVVTPAAHVRQGSKKQAEIPLIFVLLIAAFAIGSWFGLAKA